MPYLETAQLWLTQSTLLLQARPTTTRITTKYTIKAPVDPSGPSKSKPRKPKTTTGTTTEPAATAATVQPDPIRATLTLKTFDPISGTTLKYETTKSAEVSRLIQILGRLARPMVGLPEVKEDTAMPDIAAVDIGSGVATPILENVPVAGKPGGGSGGAGKKGKKKGKK